MKEGRWHLIFFHTNPSFLFELRVYKLPYKPILSCEIQNLSPSSPLHKTQQFKILVILVEYDQLLGCAIAKFSFTSMIIYLYWFPVVKLSRDCLTDLLKQDSLEAGFV